MATIELFQAAALHQLDHDERRFRRLVELMDCANAGMIEGRSCARLAPETLQSRAVVLIVSIKSLIATWRPSFWSTASNTTPMPPCPSRRMSL